jgi:class 3 adenylate cyclase/predicted ATPase
MSALEEWLKSAGLDAHVASFLKNDIEMADVFELSESDLREIGLTVGERKRFVRAVAALRLGRREAAPPLRLEEAPAGGANPHLLAERRHLTVMFCDIVGSSSLAELMDAEDVLELMQRYQNMSGTHIERFGGYIAKFLGDGIVAWFGYPSASEWDAESALRAALEIVRGMDTLTLPDGGSLKVRIGIATGHVVIGDLFGSGTAMEQPVAGVTPNLAARLQTLAPVNGIVVSENTWRLTAGRFQFQDTGTHSLRGFSLPVRAWQVLGERPVGDAADPAMLVPLAGRENEIALLRGLWRQTREVTGAVVLIQGEPGIGKSRLIDDFLAGMERHSFCRLGVHASQFNSSNPLFPVIALIERFAGIDRLDSGPERLAKLTSILAGDERDREMARQIFGPLLSIAGDGPSLGTPRQLKELTLQTLVRQLCLTAETKSLILVVEDVHWLDPTTLELLDRLIGTVRNRPIMMIMTSRDPFPQDWTDSPDVHTIELPRLPTDGSIAILRSLTAGDPLDPRIEAMIIERTDGIPLFVEELTRTLLEERAQGTKVLLDQIPIPLSLQDSLMARLDRAGPAKELAQTGAVIGRSFDRTLLSAVSDFTTEELEDALAVLIRADLIHRDGQEVYSFKHALVQDAAYRSLLRDQRRSLHARVATWLMELTPEVSDLSPDLLALHLTEAGQTDRAIGWWIRAGRRSLDRSAMQEAERHLSQALQLSDTLPEGRQTEELRMEIMVLLGPVLIFLRGPGSPEAERLYARAYELSRQFPETRASFQISWGWWRLSRDFTVMQERADSLLRHAHTRNDDGLLLQAHHCQWASHFNHGDLAECCRHIDSGLEIYDAGEYRHHASLYGNHDAKVCGHGERALVLWLAGDPNRALGEEAVSRGWAAGLGHIGSRAHALDIALMHQFYRRDTGQIMERAADMIALAEEQNFPDHRAKGLLFRGWALAQQGEIQRGLEELRTGLDRQKAIGTSEDFPVYHCMLAEVLALAGKPEEALTELTLARSEFERIGLRIWAPEMERQIGEMMRLSGGADDVMIEKAFRGALAEAARQGATSLELRAVTSLARLWERQGRADEAFTLLRPTLDRFSADAVTRDLMESRALIAKLSERLNVSWPS